MRSTKRFLCFFPLFLAAAQGQTSVGESSAAPAAPAAAFSYKGVSASGYVDTFYNQNYNHPSSRLSQAQALNLTANKLSLSSVTGSFAYDPAPVGFRVDVGYGRTYDSFFLSEPKHTGWSRYLLNAYVSVKPGAWKGLQLDFGKFVTSAGAEVTESHLNWNYSRSLLFAFGPYYHTGLRASAPVSGHWTVGGALVTGWNVVRDNNSGKTVGLTSVGTYDKFSIANTYYTGPENNGTNKGWRNFYDMVLTVTPARRMSMYVNVDAGNNRAPAGGSSSFWGVATAARFVLARRFAVAPRFDYYSDSDGFWTGTPQALKEFTLTGEMRLNDSFISRLEYRRDWCDQPYFQSGASPGAVHHQNMLVAGVMMVVRPGMFDFRPRPAK